MKTPKEKAIELFDKMYRVDDGMGSYPMCFDTAKNCALIAVDEVITELEATKFDYDLENLPFKYWEDVKQEIENYE